MRTSISSVLGAVILYVCEAIVGQARTVPNCSDLLRASIPDARAMTENVKVADAELSTSPNRREILKNLYLRVSGDGSDQVKITRVTAFVQNHIYHPNYTPVDESGTAVFDPIWILRTKLAQCGQVNRLLLDILSAGGYDTRLIQLNGHVAAEVRYSRKWHWIDGYALYGGSVILNREGEIASTMEIALDPGLLDGVETYSKKVNVILDSSNLKATFVPVRYSENGPETPFVYVKTASVKDETNKYFGWDKYETRPMSGE